MKKPTLHPLGYAQADIEGKKVRAPKVAPPRLAPAPGRDLFASLRVELLPPEAGRTCWAVRVFFPQVRPALEPHHRTKSAALHRLVAAIELLTPEEESWATYRAGESTVKVEPFTGEVAEARRAHAVACEAIKAIVASGKHSV